METANSVFWKKEVIVCSIWLLFKGFIKAFKNKMIGDVYVFMKINFMKIYFLRLEVVLGISGKHPLLASPLTTSTKNHKAVEIKRKKNPLVRQ